MVQNLTNAVATNLTNLTGIVATESAKMTPSQNYQLYLTIIAIVITAIALSVTLLTAAYKYGKDVGELKETKEVINAKMESIGEKYNTTDRIQKIELDIQKLNGELELSKARNEEVIGKIANEFEGISLQMNYLKSEIEDHKKRHPPESKSSEESKKTYWADYGWNLGNMKKYDEAIKANDEAIRLDPDYERAWNNKGWNLGMQGKHDEAIKAFDEAIKIDPCYVAAWSNKGWNLGMQGKHDEAIKAYDEAIKIDPDHASQPLKGKGDILYREGKYEDAIKAYNEAIKIDPKYAKAWYNKGIALKDLGRTSEADVAFAKANEIGYTD